MRPSPRGALSALLLTASVAAVVPPPARAQDVQGGQQRYVTIAARSCPAYTDITANRARNNIMESLKDLGADTPYGQNGVPLLVDPVVEAERPARLHRDRRTGSSRSARASRPQRGPPEPWGRLSYVTGPFSPRSSPRAVDPAARRRRPADRRDHQRRDDDHAHRRAAPARAPRAASCGSRAARRTSDHRPRDATGSARCAARPTT